MNPRLAFVGMTHLGVVSATAARARGFDVLGVDEDSALTASLSSGVPPMREPGLEDMLRANNARACFTDDFSALADRDVVYISPDVPTNDQGQSDLNGIRALIKRVIPCMSPSAVLVILCQAPPGFTRALPLSPTQLYYQVETLVFGRAMDRAMNPERIIVGCANPDAPIAPPLRAFLGAFNCPILPMRYESAELAKISINMCLVSSITVANTLAELCEHIGADWHEIRPALELDARIGPAAYLSPGLGIAGGNLERDMATVQHLGARHGTDTSVVAAWRRNSQHRRDWAVRTLLAALPEAAEASASQKPLVAVWGLAYKENTHSVKNSPSLATLRQLPHTRLRVHDPAVTVDCIEHQDVVAVENPLEAARGASALTILTPWPIYRSITPESIAGTLAGRLVIDPYRVMEPAAARRAGLIHHALGAAAPTATS